jgi:hypothetical protein
MPAPYERGQPLAWIEIDPDGLRVHRATVDTIETSPTADRWTITTDRGSTTVDATGIGADAVPLDPDIAEDLYIYGDGYLVTPTAIDLGHSLDENSSVDLGDDLGPA